MNSAQKMALERIVSIRKNMEKFLAISVELLSIDQAIVDGKTNPLSFNDHPKKTMITGTAEDEQD